jgi:hypothetical protein
METRQDVGELKTPNDMVKLKGTLSAMESNIDIYKYLYFLMPDDALVIGLNKVGRIYVDFKGTIVEVQASVITAPVGTDLICDLNLNGTTIWATQANRIKIIDGDNVATQTSFDSVVVAPGDYFTLDIDQVGSSTPGAKLVVRLKIEKGLN